VSHQKFI